ncbi:chromate transporter [Paraglaciecola sp.]|uniref:chromate transporter n=1 Tax=Paraglaciecola sp. TaxID=1920173 RepID=UPI003EF3233C
MKPLYLYRAKLANKFGIFTLLSVILTHQCFALTNEQQTVIKQASEGAPAHITDSASFMMFSQGGFELIKQGNNNFTCLVVSNPQGRYEPSCFNQEAMRSVFPSYELQMQYLYQGLSHSKTVKKLADAFKQGQLPNAEHGSLVYMMSKHNKYFDPHHGTLGDSPVHQMYFFPKLADNTFSLVKGGPFLWQGFPHLSALIVVVSN